MKLRWTCNMWLSRKNFRKVFLLAQSVNFIKNWTCIKIIDIIYLHLFYSSYYVLHLSNTFDLRFAAPLWLLQFLMDHSKPQFHRFHHSKFGFHETSNVGSRLEGFWEPVHFFPAMHWLSFECFIYVLLFRLIWLVWSCFRFWWVANSLGFWLYCLYHLNLILAQRKKTKIKVLVPFLSL